VSTRIAVCEITLRGADAGDANTVRRLVTADLAAQLAACGTDPSMAAALLDLQHTTRASQYAARFPDAQHALIERDGSPVGLVVTAVDGTELRLVDLVVDSAERGAGVGTHVLERICSTADASGQAVTLSVWSSNAGARRLYERAGFVVSATDESGYLAMRREPRGAMP